MGDSIGSGNETSRQALARVDGGMGNHPALVVVDVVVGFTDPSCPLGSDAESVVNANVQLMNAFHQAQLPVVLTTVIYRNDHEASVFRARIPALNLLTPESHWVKFDPRLPIADADLQLEKRHASSFHGTELDQWLTDRNVDSVVVTGLTTSGCVRATAVDGLQNNYRVVVPREACGDRDPKAHEANLYDLNAKYADVVSLDSVLATLAS
ncbi:isochorismatase family protein [Luminiphilus sp.]|nr:isochorismatase family protein [Luminiphilus sp.]